MSKFGINVPPGMPVFSLDDVPKAAEAMKDENNEVCLLTTCCTAAVLLHTKLNAASWACDA
jgi:hypothetical protein